MLRVASLSIVVCVVRVLSGRVVCNYVLMILSFCISNLAGCPFHVHQVVGRRATHIVVARPISYVSQPESCCC